MGQVRLTGGSVTAASFVLGRKMDSIPFSPYHVLIISVLALVGFIEGYDLFMTGSLIVLAKAPLHLTEIRHPLAAPRPGHHAVPSAASASRRSPTT